MRVQGSGFRAGDSRLRLPGYGGQAGFKVMNKKKALIE
jgi:hypothetical protein